MKHLEIQSEKNSIFRSIFLISLAQLAFGPSKQGDQVKQLRSSSWPRLGKSFPLEILTIRGCFRQSEGLERYPGFFEKAGPLDKDCLCSMEASQKTAHRRVQ